MFSMYLQLEITSLTFYGSSCQTPPKLFRSLRRIRANDIMKGKIYEILQYLMIFLIFIIIPKETELGTFAA